MERIDLIKVPDVGSRRFIGHIDGMLQRYIPDGKCLKFCVAGFDAPSVVMIKLGKTGCQFSAARARTCNDNQRFVSFNIFVDAVTFIADD